MSFGDPAHPDVLPRFTVHAVGYADPVAVALREAMEEEMRIRYADRLAVFAELPQAILIQAETIVHTGIAVTADRTPVGHFALRDAGPDVELKRMYVAPSHRGKGVSTALLAAADVAARALGARRIILQTGDRQPDAVRLYEREGFTPIPIFPPYEEFTFSTCMERVL